MTAETHREQELERNLGTGLTTNDQAESSFLPANPAGPTTPPHPRPRLVPLVRRYGLALLLVIAASLLTQLLVSLGSRPSFGLYFLAALVGAWYGGLGPGLLVTVLSALAGTYFFAPTPFTLPAGEEIMQTGVFTLVGLLTTLLATRERRAKTEAKRLLRQNRRQRQFLERVVENVPASIATLQGPEHRYTLANPKYQHLAWDRGPLLGRTVAEVWPELAGTVAPLLDRVYQTGEPFSAVDTPFLLERPAGRQEEFYSFTYLRLEDDQGRPEAVVVLGQETTAQVRARRKMEEAYALLDALFEAAPVGLGFWDRELRCTRLNPALAKTNGLPVAAHLGKTLPEIVPGLDCLDQIMATWQGIIETGQPALNVEVSGETPTWPGEKRTWLASWYPIKMGVETIGLGSVVEDVTRRKQAEEEREQFYTAGQQARRSAERSAEQLSSLLTVATAFSQAVVAEQVGRVVIEQGLAMLGASASSVTLLDPTGTTLEVLCSTGYPAELIERWRSFPLDTPVPLAEVVRTGEPIFIESPEAEVIRLPDFARRRSISSPAYAAVPLKLEGRIIGGIGLNFDKPQRFSEEDCSFILTLASQCAQALERARLYEAAQREIAAHQRTEEQLKVSLRDKELLLREVHHRVKNNLQAISNLLYMQAMYLQEGEVRQLFQETQNRIKSIALVHEQLYQTDNFSSISFNEYVSSLVQQLVKTYVVDPRTINLDIQVGEETVDIETGISLGIIITELVSNSLKYAFPAAGRRNEIGVELRLVEPDQYLLTIRDNGVGMPPDVSLDNPSSLGLRLVKMLTDFMRAAVELDRKGGTIFKIKFTPTS